MGKYQVCDVAITGDAPKDFIRIYEYGHGKRNSPNSWPSYISKVGHKWYPMESIMEHFFTRLGQSLGFRMADSKLINAHGQIRFCSRYFLRNGESLIHGAELFWGYLEDQELVQRIEAEDESRNLFTFQFVQDSILKRYPTQSFEILWDFVRMILFDAIVGNNDRHFYNWGVIEHPEEKIEPRFSPIYDTARGLFWNSREIQLKKYLEEKGSYRRKLEQYVERSRPKIGWEGEKNLNHFQLWQNLVSSSGHWSSMVSEFSKVRVLAEAEKLLGGQEFSKLMSPTRARILLDCLDLRLNYLGF
ncbi:HipA domain-containing protein [Puniceicoccus vermicola]|uniref:HipA domain-containing protein n=1 Tax=Puniceicoccus vermicola TaxID=388746 RepID=UPI0024841BBF|nr:HipA domain-containing protein [Puniceicoccus vermicola]